jgi:type IV pilus assembly protein PilB
MNLLEILADKKIIKKTDVAAITKEASDTKQSIEALLVARGVPAVEITSAVGQYYEMPVKQIAEKSIPGETLAYIPEESAVHYKFVPISVADGVLEVGIVDPDNIEAKDALNFIVGRTNVPYKLFVISEADFDKVIGMYRGLTEEVGKALSQLEPAQKEGVTFNLDAGELPDGREGDKKSKEKIVEEAPITKIVATILRYAAEGNASDVHIEHLQETIRVRFRVDGVLHTSLVLPAKVHAPVISRIKILCNMKLDEKRKPQDGRFSAQIDGRRIDFRVSTFPTYYGEKIVMRILDHDRGVKKLTELGLSPRNFEAIKRAIDKPYGLILISGPTGSGKTTTLYSMLNEFDRESYNVLSLEDPIEYSIEGVNQSQVRADIGYTFANGLRTTLRQDPDIIMVGEIRDEETAGLAIQAALTGHLVLATIHTNSAIGVIPRLIDMKVDPYLIAPTLVLALAQRLVKTLYNGTGEEVPLSESAKAMVDRQFSDLPDKFRKEIKIPDVVCKPKPSPECPTGVRGRIAVMEALEVDKDLEQLILKNPGEPEIYKMARAKGMLTMKEDGYLKAFQKQVALEEVFEL